MFNIEAPDIEILDPVLAVDEMQCAALAQRDRKQPVSIQATRTRLAPKMVCAVQGGEIAEAVQVPRRDAYVGAAWHDASIERCSVTADKTLRAVRRHWDAIERIAWALHECGRLEHDDIERILRADQRSPKTANL
jgi:hypothetical protein